MKKIQRIAGLIKHQIARVRPGRNALKGAAISLLVFTAIIWLSYTIGSAINEKDYWLLLLSLLVVLCVIILAFGLLALLKLLRYIPKFYKLALFIVLPLFLIMDFSWIIISTFILVASLIGAALFVLNKTRFQNLDAPKKVVTILALIAGVVGIISIAILYAQIGYELTPIENAAFTTTSNIKTIEAISPADKGSYAVNSITYGSGKDLRRVVFGEAADIQTKSVNGLAFIDAWEGFGGWFREKYWGFTASALPINGRVWYPEGEGPFPLVLVVHGNHSMQDFSDTGYSYLGELLASKGFICASVDQNFINGSWSNIFGGLEKENDARAWLLLEHLRVWHEWNTSKSNPFYQKIDTSNIALIGHSRGGEAVAHAAMFNKLPFYPDDASVAFDYNYAIKSIVAIAPVDGQYEPSGSRTALENINYFVIHGAQDADVTSFMGSQQYERIKFTDSLYYFKSGLYVYGANHGQFNTSWGNNDTGNPFTGLLNLKQLISATDQEKIAKVYISSFLDITLKNKKEYLPLFLDARTGKNWLPETIYLSQFEDASLQTISNFEEDFDVATTTLDNGEIFSNNLSVWREEELPLKWQSKGSKGVFIGWDYELEDEKEMVTSVPDSLIASYTLKFSLAELDSLAVLSFAMAASPESSNPKSEGKWVQNEDSTEDTANNETAKEEPAERTEEDQEPEKSINFTVQLTDVHGQVLSFPLSDFSPLQRPLEVSIMKEDFITDQKESEMIFQTFYFPTSKFRELNPDFNPLAIKALTFIFDKTPRGVIAIDHIGFMKSID